MSTSTSTTSGQTARFDTESQSWDAKPHVHEMAGLAASAIAQRIPLDPTMTCLDFGCGTGVLSFLLAPKVGTILGVDVSKGMIDMFQSKIVSSAAPEGTLTTAAMMLENPAQLVGLGGRDRSGKFDLAFSHMVAHHIRDIPALVRLLHGCLTPGGHLVITDFETSAHSERFHPKSKSEGVEHHGMDNGLLRRSFEEAGFADVVVERGFSVVKEMEEEGGFRMTKGDSEKEWETLEFGFVVASGRRV